MLLWKTSLHHVLWKRDDVWYCPVCQGQNIFESGHPVAREIEERLEQMSAAGYTDEEIQDHFHHDYGDALFGWMPHHAMLPTLFGLAYLWKWYLEKNS